MLVIGDTDASSGMSQGIYNVMKAQMIDPVVNDSNISSEQRRSSQN